MELEEHLKPPKASAWILAVVGGASLTYTWLDWPSPMVFAWMWALGAGVGIGIVARWLGRVIGFLARDMAEQGAIGWREGVERSQRERAEQQARQRR